MQLPPTHSQSILAAQCSPEPLPSCLSKYPWSGDLVRQIKVIKEKDPSKADELYMRIMFLDWSKHEVRKLSRAGLDVSRVVPNPGLLGGMLEGATLAFKVTAGVIEIILEGNKKQVLAEKDTQLIAAKAFLSGRGDVKGHHEGGRILSEGTRSLSSVGMKRFHLIATGKGRFISEDVRYEGEFYNNVFHDLTGDAKLIIDGTRYTGCFRNGKKCGHGKLEKYDKVKNQHFLYYEGLFEEDRPTTGTVYTSSGEMLARYEDGVLEQAVTSAKSQGSLTSQGSSKVAVAQQVLSRAHPSVPTAQSDRSNWAIPPRSDPNNTSQLGKGPALPRNGDSTSGDATTTARTGFTGFFSFLGRMTSQSAPQQARPSKKRTGSTVFNPDVHPEIACPLISRKLENPRSELSLNDSIELLTTCIRYGQERAEKIAGKEGVIVIGNTGAGKSTMVNYLTGCKMVLKTPQQLGLKGIDKLVVVLPRAQGGTLDEVMPIGHTKESKTFMPQIETDSKEQITYCDCPGFLDNRGAEINIANAVNVKNAMSMAKGVKVIVLINYYSLKADRARGLNDMLTICTHLFGRSENIVRYKDSLLLGVSNAPRNLDLYSLKEWIVEGTPEIMQTLAKRLFLFDPLDRPLSGGWKRSECLRRIKSLKPIEHPGSIFKTVLTDTDEKKLMQIGEAMKSEIEDALTKNDFSLASARLKHLDSLGVIDHIAIERLLTQAFYHVTMHFRKVIDDFRSQCHFENFGAATTILESLKKGLKEFGDRLKDVIELKKLNLYYSTCEKRCEQRLAKEKAQQQQIEKTQGQVEQLLRLLEDQKKDAQKEISRQEAIFKKLKSQMESRIQETESNYLQLESTLKQELNQRLQQKDEELRLAQKLGQQELNKTLRKEKEEIEKAYEEKLKQSQEEKAELLKTQQKELESREQQNLSRQKALEEKLAAIESQKAVQEQKKQKASRQHNSQRKLAETTSQKTAQMRELKDISRPQIAFGKAEWEKYFGDVGEEPPLPKNINEILKSQCVYWPDKKVEETHLLVLIPKTVDGKALTIKSLGELIKRPRGGGHATNIESLETFLPQIEFLLSSAKKEDMLAGLCSEGMAASLKDKGEEEVRNAYIEKFKTFIREVNSMEISCSYWALVSKDVIPDSRDKSYADQCKLVASSYRVSRSLELATSILMHHVRTGERLYSDSPGTFGRCEELLDGWQVGIGGFGSGGLSVCDVHFSGLSVSRKFSPW